MEKVNFVSYETFKSHLGVKTIKWVKCANREMADIFGIQLFTAKNLDWNRPCFICEGEHGNLYVVNMKEDRKVTER